MSIMGSPKDMKNLIGLGIRKLGGLFTKQLNLKIMCCKFHSEAKLMG